jgi:hypothetical protein
LGVKTSHEEEPMKALVYGGPGKREWKDVPKPGIKDPTDAIVRVTAVTICTSSRATCPRSNPDAFSATKLWASSTRSVLRSPDSSPATAY